MTRARIITLLVLLVAPIVFLAGAGSYHLWISGWAFWAWWPMGLCFAAAYILAWRWQRSIRLKQAEAPPSLHWTDDHSKFVWVTEQDGWRHAWMVDRAGQRLTYDNTRKRSRDSCRLLPVPC